MQLINSNKVGDNNYVNRRDKRIYRNTAQGTHINSKPYRLHENATDYLMKQLETMGYAPQLSNKGNVSVEIGGEGAPLVLAAHVDTLGAMVRSIKDNGRLRPTTIGGHQWSTADGENCMVFTRDGRMYTGVVLNTEPSAHVADEKSR